MNVIKMRGYIELALHASQGGPVLENRKVPVEFFEGDNTITTAGRRWVLEQICSSEIATAESISHMAIGTGTTAPATSDTALVNEVSRKAIGTFTTTNLTSNPPSWRAECSWATNEANTTLGEVCLVNSSSSGTVLGRATFTTINKATSNTLTISYTVSN